MWFKIKHNVGFLISGLILKAQAKNFAEKLGYTEFPCGNRWPNHFKNRHYAQSSGENMSLDMKTTNDWVKNVRQN